MSIKTDRFSWLIFLVLLLKLLTASVQREETLPAIAQPNGVAGPGVRAPGLSIMCQTAAP